MAAIDYKTLIALGLVAAALVLWRFVDQRLLTSIAAFVFALVLLFVLMGPAESESPQL